MRLKQVCVAAAVVASIGPAVADPVPPPPGQPDVATLLFSIPQWDKAPVGTGLTYEYTKKVEAAYGPSFDDKMVLKLDKGDDPKARTVDVQLFTGPQAKPAGPFRSTEQNPAMLIALEANVEDLAHAWHANARFMKKAIREAWRNDAKIEKTQVEVAGRRVPGTRITIEPYKDSPEKDKMLGLQTMVYAIELVDDLPGQIATVDIHAPATGAPTFREVLRYQSATKP